MKNTRKAESVPSQGIVSQARRALGALLWSGEPESPRRGRLLLEALEGRQMMAADQDMLFTDGVPMDAVSTGSHAAFVSSSVAEGEAAQDLVGFAKALSDAGVKYYGAAWCPLCTDQKELFQDGGKYLPFIEVTRADRSINAVGTAAGITTFPTWEFPDGTRATGVLSLETLRQRSGVAIPSSDRPSFATLGGQTVAIGSPLNIPIDAYDPGGGPVTITVSVADPTLLQATVLPGNPSIRMDMRGYGDMVFELFQQQAPRPVNRIIELANSNFYDGIQFHRVIDNFVIQAGDPTATGTGGSTLGTFNDQFNLDLQHNRAGILSYAKSSDDTNDSQFFITQGPTRTLDFNHSIFGQLVEGRDVLEAIGKLGAAADKGTNSSDKPLIPVEINSVRVFNDNENSVVMLKAIGNRTGTTNVTFTATDASGSTYSEVVAVTVVQDSGSGSNSQPFLNDIPTPAPITTGQPATLQLSSQDVEGDAVTYTAVSGTTGVTASVNASTGLVTVTPSATFAGTASITVGVQPAAGVVGALSGQNDTQRVTYTVQAATSTLSAPTGVTLAAASDSGSSNSDGRTNAGSLTFNVTGVTAGNEIRLYSGTTEIGRGTATGTTATVTTNNIAALGDGTYTITARQFSGTANSNASPSMTVVYDGTQPIVVTGFPASANVSVPINVNLNHAEEGNGLRYAFTTAAAGATIDASTGQITWTPTTAQIGAQAFTLTLTDTAGNVRTSNHTVTVAAAPQAGTRLELANLTGTVITNIEVGQEFLLRFYANDLRGTFDRSGVFAAFTDVRFDSTRVTPVTTTPIQFAPGINTGITSGSFEPGLINELGGVLATTQATRAAETLIATVRMRATSAGPVSFVSSEATDSGNEFLLFDNMDETPASAITYGRADLNVGGRFTVANDTVSVAQNAAATTVNVLANDRFNVGATGTLTIASVGTTSAGGVATIVNNQIQYRPATGFAGTETFTYVARDETGATQTATVTATVTGTNNPPPTAAPDTFAVVEDAAEASFNVRQNDSTTDAGETISVTGVGTSSRGGTVRLGTGGTSIFYRPALNFNGAETVTYTLTDSRGATATGTVTFNVSAVNDAPPAQPITVTVFQNGGLTDVATLAGYGTNVDGAAEVITVALVGTASAGGTFTVAGTTIRYAVPSATFLGTDTITYRTTDAGGLSSTGTITVTVTAGAPTSFRIVAQGNTGANVSFGSTFTASLTGTTTGGQTVNRTMALNSLVGGTSNAAFDQLAPGSYTVDIPSVAFLVGMNEPTKFTFTATPEGGTRSGTLNVGALHPSFISIRDFFNNAPTASIFAAVAAGQDSVAVFGARSATNIVSPIVNLNAASTSITVRANTTTGTATQATIPAVNDPRVETRGTSGGFQLVKIDLTPQRVTFPGTTPPPANTPPPVIVTTPQSASGTTVSPASFGESSTTITAEGEASMTSGSVVMPSAGNTGVFASNASLAEGEPTDEEIAADNAVTVPMTDASDPVGSTDAAFATVADTMTMFSKSGDDIATNQASAPSPSAVDELLSDGAVL